MKGVILSVAPSATIIDIAHDVPRHDIAAAAWTLGAVVPYLPRGTVVCAVVDPGVGGARRPIAVEAGGRAYVAPDNGILTEVLAGRWRAVEIVPRGRAVGTTFHGRDVFAPAAARLAAGARLEALGPAIRDPVYLPPLPLRRRGGRIDGAVAHVDAFGNLVTNIPAAWLRRAGRIVVMGERPLSTTGIRPSYESVRREMPVAVISSRGTLEVAARGASAARRAGARRGTPVRVYLG